MMMCVLNEAQEKVFQYKEIMSFSVVLLFTLQTIEGNEKFGSICIKESAFLCCSILSTSLLPIAILPYCLSKQYICNSHFSSSNNPFYPLYSLQTSYYFQETKLSQINIYFLFNSLVMKQMCSCFTNECLLYSYQISCFFFNKSYSLSYIIL